MSIINSVVVACYKGDVHLTRICVASIRFWYPDIEIYLLKDYLAGDFDTSEIETNFHVKILNTQRRYFGWGLSKLEPYFWEEKKRILIIDSDVVFVGKVIDELEKHDEDFILCGESPLDFADKRIQKIYFDVNKVKAFDPQYDFLGFFFNSGHIVTNTGIFNRSEFNSIIDWSGTTPVIRRRDIFPSPDQSILNYFFSIKRKQNSYTFKNLNFVKWGEDRVCEIKNLEASKIFSRVNEYPFLIHWAGGVHFLLEEMCGANILTFYEKEYYSKIPLGRVKYFLRKSRRVLQYSWLFVIKAFIRKVYRMIFR